MSPVLAYRTLEEECPNRKMAAKSELDRPNASRDDNTYQILQRTVGFLHDRQYANAPLNCCEADKG